MGSYANRRGEGMASGVPVVYGVGTNVYHCPHCETFRQIVAKGGPRGSTRADASSAIAAVKRHIREAHAAIVAPRRRRLGNARTFERIARNLRRYGYADATAQMVSDAWDAICAGRASNDMPHDSVGWLAHTQLVELRDRLTATASGRGSAP